MKAIVRLAAAASSLLISHAVLAQKGAPLPKAPTPPPPPPVSRVAASPESNERFVYEQKLFSSRPYLITPEQAQAIIGRFREAYPRMGNPRFLIYVNRELIDQNSGLKLSARSETTELVRSNVHREFQPDGTSGAVRPAGTNPPAISGSVVFGGVQLETPDAVPGKGRVAGELEKTTSKQNYRLRERPALSLTDKQTVRDVERLFGRPLRLAGARLADQDVASQVYSNPEIVRFSNPTEGQQAARDREALRKVADVAIEILISSRNASVSQLAGERTVLVPDIQATAIRLSDSAIVGQATASDLIGQNGQAARMAGQFDVREITEATALSLMEDMLLR